MTTRRFTSLLAGLACAFALVACGPGGPGDAGSDTGTGDAGDTGGSSACNTYCTTVMNNCTGENAQYPTMAECLSTCANSGWEEGTPGAQAGNSIACRTYHGGAPAMMSPAMHCSHAGASGGDVCGSWCENYCQVTARNCTGANALYPSAAACMTACAMFPTTGRANDQSGNTVQCRIYHGGQPSRMDPAMHCGHAGPGGGGVCGMAAPGYNFRTEPATMFTRVDRMGMPAVATALIGAMRKDAYNDANPTDDAAGMFVPELAMQNTGLHTALDDDLRGLNLTACSMTMMVNGLPECFGQNVAPGVTVASLVVPDTLRIDPASPAGFPNGRRLQDPVIDVTLSIILLRMGGTCGSGMCSPATLAGVPVNPARNDVNNGMFLADFPYLHPPHRM